MQRTTWKVEVAGGVTGHYVVLGQHPLEAAVRAWRLDQPHADHGERTSILVQVNGLFDDTEGDIPDAIENQLRTKVDAIEARLAAIEARSTSTAAGR